ncbi:MAG: CRISPR-associated protein Cas4 [Clostridiaceae bacterium BRH_c20a]|nr:MAG: CRISPR-associated protein Cas4 [Clostridiaceae bacterium BRH_c20a]
MIDRFNDEDLLALSGIQHFAFCPRQWALIHIEKQWTENLLTVEGKQLHERVDNPDFFEARGGILTTRSVSLASYTLGFYGVADIVEFHAVKEKGIRLHGREGIWKPIPVEYKRGKPKKDIIDEVQLCTQAMCLEEMLLTKIEHGYLFYGETRHREKVTFDVGLRGKVADFAEQMHILYEKQFTPLATKKEKSCKACSLVDVCLPKLGIKQTKVVNYIRKYVEQE